MRLLFVVALIALCWQPSAQSSESTLERWLTWHGLSGRFTQREYDANLNLSRTSQGTMILQRPDSALWQLLEPDPQTFYVTQQGVWHYDPWLEVATFHSIQDRDENQAALSLFSNNKDALEEQYTITEENNTLRFEPRRTDSQVQSVLLVLTDQGYPQRLEVETTLGHQTVIDIESTVPGKFAASVFEFSPPLGTEIQ